MSVWGKVTGKRKAFLSLLCDGVPPYNACRQVWPKLKDVHGHVARIFADTEFRQVHYRLTEHQSSRETLLSDCKRIIDSNCKHADRLNALKIMAMIKGYIANVGRPVGKPKRGQAESELDPALLNKMADLGRKAYDDKRRPS